MSRDLFLAAIAALYLGSSLTHWLTPGAELGQSYKLVKTTMQQCNNATMQQCNNATIQQYNNTTIQQCSNATMQQCNKISDMGYGICDKQYAICDKWQHCNNATR